MKRILIFAATGVTAAVVAFAFFMMREEHFEPIEPGQTFRVGVECDYAPYNWEESQASDTNMPLSNNKGFYAEGYDIQIARLIAKNMEAKMEFVKIPWGDLLPALKDGKVDMIISGMADNADRKALPDFSHSQNYTEVVAEYCVMVKKGSRYLDATTLADFYGASIIGQKGTRLDTVIDQIPNVNHVPPVEVFSDMLTKLNDGTVDGVVIGVESTQEYAKAYPDFAVVRFSRGQGFKLDFTGACVWFRKGDRSLHNAVNKALSEIPAQTRKALMDQADMKKGA